MSFSVRRASALTFTVGPALAYLAAVDPDRPGHYPSCPIRAVTGLDCPGCGSLRALHSLTQGDPLGALDHNALLVVALPLVVVAGVLWVLREAPLRLVYARNFGWAVVGVVALWAALRNLPFAPFAALGSA